MITVSEEMRAMIESRQITKRQAIRSNPIYDREIFIPVRDTQIRCLEFIPKQTGTLPVLFDFHGGGFTNGFPEEDDYFCRLACDRLQMRVFSIEYRLAPDHPYPEGQLDGYEVVSYLAENHEAYGIDPDKMVISGHSAGGNIAVSVVLRGMENRNLSFKGMVLDYPPLDVATPAKDKFYTEGCIPIELSDLFNASYRRPEQAADPMCSPRFLSDDVLKTLPPAVVVSCEMDSLREEDEEFATRLIANGVEVTAKRFLGQCHAFTVQYDNPAALEAIDMMVSGIGRFLEK